MKTVSYNDLMEALTNNPVKPFDLSWENTVKIIRKLYDEAKKRKDDTGIWWLKKQYGKYLKKGGGAMHKSRVNKMLQDALDDEHKGVSFYREMLKLPGLSDEDRQVIRNIIEDEKRHYEALSDMAQAMEKTRSRKEWEEVTERKKREYEGVPRSKFADPEHRSYPVDTPEHTRAAWSYINMPKNASKYSKEKLAEVKRRIKRAAKRFGIKISEGEK